MPWLQGSRTVVRSRVTSRRNCDFSISYPFSLIICTILHCCPLVWSICTAHEFHLNFTILYGLGLRLINLLVNPTLFLSEVPWRILPVSEFSSFTIPSSPPCMPNTS